MTHDKKSSEPKQLSRRDLLFRPFSSLRSIDTPSSAPSGLDSESIKADQAFKQGDWKVAKTLYADVAARRPDDVESRRRLALCLYRLDEFESAGTELSSILSQIPKDSFATLYLGLCQAAAGNLPAAVGVWKTYFNLDQPLILREINLQLALFEAGTPPSEKEVVCAVEEAIARQKKSEA